MAARFFLCEIREASARATRAVQRSMPYVGRLAPSPTGYLHLGHAATFLTAAARAQAAGGRLLLRIDDLDTQRSRDVYVEAAREDLAWLGIAWESEVRQSQRLEQYRAALEQLLLKGLVYPCRCSRRELQQATQAPHEETDDEPLYNNRCRPAQAAPAGFAADVSYRFRLPPGERLAFVDGACGPQEFIAGVDLGDFLIWRRDGLPSYQLATVVDDAGMGITEVVRGRDLLKSTARQLALSRALGLPSPAYLHTELLRDSHGERLAKRHDALSLRTLRAEGCTTAEIRSRVEAALHHNG